MQEIFAAYIFRAVTFQFSLKKRKEKPATSLLTQIINYTLFRGEGLEKCDFPQFFSSFE